MNPLALPPLSEVPPMEIIMDLASAYSNTESLQKYREVFKEVMFSTETKLIESESLKRPLTQNEVAFLRFTRTLGRRHKPYRHAPYGAATEATKDMEVMKREEATKDKEPKVEPTKDKEKPTRDEKTVAPSSLSASASGDIAAVNNTAAMNHKVDLVTRFDRMRISEYS
jgi:hypothetical protein